MSSSEKIGIVGSGLIGRSWALLFLGAGYEVCLYDLSRDQLENALIEIKKKLLELTQENLLRSTIPIDDQLAMLKITTSLAECIDRAVYVQECVWEDAKLKRDVFEKIDKLAKNDQILASSSSTILGSEISNGMTNHKNRFVIAHPVNPPFFCLLVEIVPAPWTDQQVVEKTYEIMKKIGQTPVKLKKEVAGFAVNRLQYALLAECWRLVGDDVIDVRDLDAVMTAGLGMRYAFLGPLEVAHLNANGIEDYADKYNDVYLNVCSTFGPTPSWKDPKILAKMKKQLEAMVPIEKLDEKRRWRDKCLANLAKLKKAMAG